MNRFQLNYFNRVKYRSSDHPVVSAYADPKVDFVKRHAPMTGAILDLGCGNGVFTQRLARDGGVVTGLDFSDYLLSRNAHHGLVCGDATRLPFQDEAFDVVFEGNLLHHVTDPTSVLIEMHRVSRKYVIVLEPNRYNPIMFAFSVVVQAERGGLKSCAKYLQHEMKAVGIETVACLTTGMISQNNTPQLLLPVLRRFDRHIWWGEYIVIVGQKIYAEKI